MCISWHDLSATPRLKNVVFFVQSGPCTSDSSDRRTSGGHETYSKEGFRRLSGPEVSPSLR